MDFTQQIAATRARRTRARQVQVVVMLAALVTTVVMLAVLPRRSALTGIVSIVMSAALVGATFIPFRADEWHRRRAVQAVAWGYAASVGWLTVEALRFTFEAGHRVNPGRALAAAGAGWLLGDFFLRRWNSEEDDGEDAAS